jgi:NAD(P)-dependent dehydrogenase (short-subunit alcohol dehydrogenase family)
MARLQGKVAIVTGGAAGIGRHYSQALAAAGAQVMIADIVDGKAVAEEIAGKSGANSVATTRFDVSDEAAVKTAVQETLDRFGQIDVLVNNAALYAKLTPTKYSDIDIALWDQVMAVNVRGSFLMVKHVAPHMQERKSGKIINIASGTAYKGIPHMLHYVTSKGAIVAFTRALSRELGTFGIAVNTLAPGLVLSDTGIENKEHHDEMRAPIRNSRAFKRDMYPEDLLGALVFLASDDSNFVTGQTLAVDGGSINT